MLINSNQSTTDVNQLISQLVRKFDTDHDGRLSTEEFGVFLSKFLQGTPGEATPPNSQAATGQIPPHMYGSAAKWNDPSHTTPKYVVGRLIAQYGNGREAVVQAMPEIETLFPGAKFDGDDVIDFGTNRYDGQLLGKIDVLRDSYDLQWIDLASREAAAKAREKAIRNT